MDISCTRTGHLVRIHACVGRCDATRAPDARSRRAPTPWRAIARVGVSHRRARVAEGDGRSRRRKDRRRRGRARERDARRREGDDDGRWVRRRARRWRVESTSRRRRRRARGAVGRDAWTSTWWIASMVERGVHRGVRGGGARERVRGDRVETRRGGREGVGARKRGRGDDAACEADERDAHGCGFEWVVTSRGVVLRERRVHRRGLADRRVAGKGVAAVLQHAGRARVLVGERG